MQQQTFPSSLPSSVLPPNTAGFTDPTTKYPFGDYTSPPPPEAQALPDYPEDMSVEGERVVAEVVDDGAPGPAPRDPLPFAPAPVPAPVPAPRPRGRPPKRPRSPTRADAPPVIIRTARAEAPATVRTTRADASASARPPVPEWLAGLETAWNEVLDEAEAAREKKRAKKMAVDDERMQKYGNSIVGYVVSAQCKCRALKETHVECDATFEVRLHPGELSQGYTTQDIYFCGLHARESLRYKNWLAKSNATHVPLAVPFEPHYIRAPRQTSHRPFGAVN